MIDVAPLVEKLRQEFAGVETQLADPTVFEDRERSETLSRRHRQLSELLRADDELRSCRRQLTDNEALLAGESDPEFCALVEADNAALAARAAKLESTVLTLVLPPDENASRNTIVEIRPAAGGDEAALFASDLFRMYSRFAERQSWRLELLSHTDTPLGGIREVSFSLQGRDVYQSMHLESGVHRVQRIPVTETGGRIHTSTITVAVLPEAKDVDIELSPDDLRVEVFRSSGPGGQHVNTTDSAVRITHLPSGLTVSSQQEKSQHRNREIALRILRARLLERKQREAAEAYAARRRSQVGTGDRSERIRTYNFPQNRVTDHRFGLSWHNLPAVLEGDLEELLEAIRAADAEQRLAEELAEA